MLRVWLTGLQVPTDAVMFCRCFGSCWVPFGINSSGFQLARPDLQVFELLSGILWLGNITFEAKTEDSVALVEDEALHNAAALLQCQPQALVAALTKRNIVARGETIVTNLKLEGANDARSADFALACVAALHEESHMSFVGSPVRHTAVSQTQGASHVIEAALGSPKTAVIQHCPPEGLPEYQVPAAGRLQG